MFCFTKEANNLILSSVQKIERNVKCAIGNVVDKKMLELFLSDVENEIRFLAARFANSRQANVVEVRDIKNVFRRLWIDLMHKPRSFIIYDKFIQKDVKTIERETKFSKSLLILDAGCGWGRASRWFYELLDEKVEVVGIDLDAFSLKYGKFLNRKFSFIRAHMGFSTI